MFLKPSATIALLGSLLLLSACGDDGGSADPEANLPRSNGLFTYEPGAEGAAPGYYVEASIDGRADPLTSNEAELRLYTERQYAEQQAESRVDKQSARRNPRGHSAVAFGDYAPDIIRKTRSPELPVSFGASEVADRRAFDFDALRARLDTRVPILSARVGAQQLRDDDGDGIPEDPDLPKCTGGENVGCSDNCPFVANQDQADDDLDRIGNACEGDPDGDGIQSDGDGSGVDGDNPCASTQLDDCDDNCPNVPNRRQWDVDGDGTGDACDPDSDGNGTLDLDEGSVDHDNDGVPTSLEGDVDSDGDGIPDYLDPDDDGDGVPSRLENERPDGTVDPDLDTDGDGVPDSRDTDADGDGISDGNEGIRDTDGNGVPDFKDDDDDGDGILTRDEYNGPDQDEDGDGIPNHLDAYPDDGCEERKLGGIYPTIPTFGGWTQWNAITFTVTAPAGPCTVTDKFPVCPNNDYTWAIHLGLDGLYFSLQRSQGVSIPPDIYGIGVTQSVGWMMSPDGDGSMISGKTMSDGRNLSISTELFGFTQGFTILETPGAGFSSPRKFLQLDVGYSISISWLGLFGFGFFPNISLALSDGGITIETADGDPGFQLIAGWGGLCPGEVNALQDVSLQRRLDKQAGGSGGSPALNRIAASVRAGASAPVASVNDSYRRDVASSTEPLTAMLMGGSGYGSAQNVPAPTMGDWVNEFLGSDNTETCRDCVNMSMNGLIARTAAATVASEGDGNALALRAREQAGQLAAAWPEKERAATLMGLAVGGSINAGTELAFSVAAARRGDPDRFVSSQIVDVPVVIDTPASFTVTADEIATLIGYPAVDVEGATVCVENNPRIDATCGVIEGGELTGTITPDTPDPWILSVDVDLSTAAGRFDDADVSRWTVRPAVRRFSVESAPPANVALTYPGSLKSGAPATLNATIVDDEGRLSRVQAEFRLYDGAGTLVDTVANADGAASFQVQPAPQTPSLDAVDAREVGTSEGPVPGYVLSGRQISADARILIDGQDVESLGYLYTVKDSRSVGVAVVSGSSELSSGSHEFVIVNPGGARSDALVAPIP